jgi:hypothetical protein
MRKATKQAEDNNRLVAKIEQFEISYYFLNRGMSSGPTIDEGRIDIVTTIQGITPKLKRFDGLPFAVGLAIERLYAEEGRTVLSDRPFMLPVQLSKAGGSCFAYLPADAFWEIPRLIDTGRFSHIDIGFGTLHRGSAELGHLYFCPQSKLEPF